MLTRGAGRCIVVVIEQGAAWPAELSSWRGPSTDVVAITQLAYESHTRFMGRVQARLAALDAGRIDVCVAALAVGSERGDELRRGRRRLARLLAGAVSRQRGGQFVVFAPADASRGEVLGLADAVLHGATKPDVVSVRFSELPQAACETAASSKKPINRSRAA